MRARFLLSLSAALGVLASASHATAQGTAGVSPYHNMRATPTTQPTSNYQTTGRSNPALDFYGGSRSLAYAPQSRPVPLPAPVPVQTRPIAKPFSNVQQTSAMSPYLALDVRESETSIPNYYLYVKPHLDQRRLNHVQQAQYRRLQQQVRTATAGGAVSGPNGGIPTTGHSAQFMNNGGYYPGLR